MAKPIKECFILDVEGVKYTLRTIKEVHSIVARYMLDGGTITFKLQVVRP